MIGEEPAVSGVPSYDKQMRVALRYEVDNFDLLHLLPTGNFACHRSLTFLNVAVRVHSVVIKRLYLYTTTDVL